LAGLALDKGDDLGTLKAAEYPGESRTVAEQLTHLVATVGEHMNLRRVKRLQVGNGAVASYVHNALAVGLGKIGVLVALESTGDPVRLAALGKQLAMHIAAANPQFIDVASVDAASLDRERDVLREQARASGKPDAIIEKMVDGRIRKYYEEVVLLEQIFVIDGESRVAKVVDAVATEVGAPIAIAGFVRYALGEGIEKESTDFAAEVAAQLGR
jgi:elongation factor Ts